ncbi:caspase family protein [Desulfoluna sp.]|uniref:WD40 domain-containing protein n=1 Tax=Desulfoluna sp. TaxID=2045199 RepID=UPI00262E7C2A|nr:caspase family protein [Desulfoluna sp.]
MRYFRVIAVALLFFTLTGCGLPTVPVPDYYLQAEKIKSTDVFKKQTVDLHKKIKATLVIQQLHTGSIGTRATALEYSPDGELIVTCSEDGLIKIWDAESGNLLQDFENKVKRGKDKEINDVSFSPDGKYIVTAGGDGQIKIWDIITGTLLKSFSLDPLFAPEYKKDYLWARCVDYSPDGKRVVAGGCASVGDYISYYPLKVWDISSGKEVLSMEGITNAIGSVKFSPNGKLILSGCDIFGTYMQLWDAQTGSLLSTMSGPDDAESVAFSPDSQFAAGGFRGGNISVWNLKTGAKVLSQKMGRNVSQVKFSPDGHSLFLCGSYFDKINLANGMSESIVGKTGGREFDLSPDGKQYTVIDSGEITTWTIDNKKLALKFKNSSAGTSGGITEDAIRKGASRRDCGFFHGSDQLLIAEGFVDGHYSKHHVNVSRGGKIILSVKIPLVTQMEFSKNGDYLFVSSHGGMKRIDINNRTVSDFIHCNGTIFDFSPDGKFVISGNVNSGLGGIGLWNVYTNKLVKAFDGHNGRVYTLKFTENGRRAISTGADGMTRYWNVETGKLICSKMESEKKNAKGNREWLVVTPSGHYDKSPGFEGVHVVKGLNVLELDQLFDLFYIPGLMDQVLKTGGAPKMVAGKTIDIMMESPPPTVTILSPEALTYGGKDIATSTKATLEVVLNVKNNGGGIQEITLFHNGKPVEGKQRGLKKVSRTDSRSQTVAFPVTLLDGENTFMAVAKSKTGIESRPFNASVLYKNPEFEKPDAYFVIVGINKYKNTKYNLNYGRADAEAISAVFRMRSKKLFKTLHVTELFDKKATKNNISRALDNVVTSAKPKDVFVLYYAGHGVMVENEKGTPHFYIAPHEVTSLYREQHIWANGISAEQLTGYSKKIKARKQMLIMDACQAGGFEQTFAMRGAVEEKALKQLSRSSGIYLLAATQSEQFATEFASLKHGVFTYALLKGLQGEADGSPKDGKTTVRELSAFIEDKVPGLTETHRGNAQYPSIYGRGQDFPILLSH